MQRAGKKCCGRDPAFTGDGGPEGLFLNRVEDEAWGRGLLEGIFEPSGLDEAVVIENLWSGPCAEALALAGAMELRGDGAGGAFAGGDDEATAQQPRIDI
jgi:hypothetical protein